jgi:hypothetical protein
MKITGKKAAKQTIRLSLESFNTLLIFRIHSQSSSINNIAPKATMVVHAPAEAAKQKFSLSMIVLQEN